MADYKTPQWLLPNEKNLAYPAAGDGITGSGLSEDRQSLYSMDFDGTAYIDAGAATVLTQTSQLSVSFWVNQNDTTAFDYYLSIGDNGGSPTEFLELYSHPTASRSFNIEGSIATAGFQSFDFTSYVSNNTWFHIALVWDSTESVATDRIKVYIDGTLRASLSGVTSTFNTNGEIKIGRTWRNTSNTIDGKLDEVAIFNTALTASEVQALSTASAPANVMALSAKPVAYYPLGEQAQMGYSNWNFPNGSLQSHVVDFDGTDYVSTGLSLAYDDVPTWTISYWIKCDSASFTNFDSYFAVGVDVSGGTYNYAAGRLYKQGGGLNAGIQGASFSFGTTNLSDGKWHNIVQTYVDQGSNVQTSNIYIDGNSTPEATSNTSQFQKLSGDLFLGFRNSGSAGSFDNPFIGEVSNVAVWSSDQSANLTNIYNNGSPQSTYTATPTSWWKLNAADSSYNTATSTWTFTDGPGTNDGTSTTLPSTALIPSDLQFESPYSNYSLDFDGATNYIDTNYTFPTISTWSVSFWVNINDPGNTNYYYHFTARNSSTTGLVIWSGSGLSSSQRNFSAKINNTTITFSVASFDTWYNITVTGDGSNLTAYVNGVQVATTAISTLFPTLTYTTKIGSNKDGTNYFLNGKIDETAIWNSALTQAQISQVYNNGYPADLTSLSPSQWWRLGEDAFFVSNVVTIPNQITGGTNGTGSGTQSAFLVGEAPGSYANGLGSSLVVTDRIGDAPESTANSVSINMIPSNRHSYPAGYAPTQVNNVYSMVFDGIDDYFSITSSGTLDTFHQNPFSVSFWFKTSTGGTMILTEKATSSSATSRAFYIYLSSGAILWYGATASPSYTNGSYNDGNWHHIACVAESDTVARIYVDGVDDTNNIAKDRIGTSSVTAPIILGTTYNQSGFFFNGSMDEVALFDYALSAKQIKQDIYNGTTTGKTADLNNISNLTAPIAWYRMGD